MQRGTKPRRGREFWETALREQGQSGCSVGDYCREKGLEPVTFYAWRKRLGEAAESSQDIHFTPITVCASAVSGTELVLPGGLILRTSGLFPVDYLRELSAAYVVV